MNSFIDSLAAKTIEHKSKMITEALTKYMGTRPAQPVKVNSEIVEGYIFFIGWAIAKDGNIYSHAYKMYVCDVWGNSELYEDTNVIDSEAYTLTDVKNRAYAYLNHHATNLKKLLNK